MKPLIRVVVAICLVISTRALPNIAEVNELQEKSAPAIETEDDDSQSRAERCTTCGPNLSFKSPHQVLAALQALPGGEVHTQSSFEGCSSDKGCAGIRVKDGKVLEKFGNIDAFRQAAAADVGNEFTFHAAESFGSGVLQGGIPKEGPFWWMNENSPFKAGAGGAGYEKFSSSSSSYSSNGAAGGANGAGFGANLDLAQNPFLNGESAKFGSGFTSQGGAINGGSSQFQESSSTVVKPSNGYQQSSFESSSFSSSSNKNGEVDISKNPFLNGGFKNQAGFAGQSAFAGQGGFGGAQNAGSQGYSSSSGSKYSSSGYTGSSPSPFTASTAGSNINLIQNTQKASEFDYEQQQQQQNIDEIFQETGNVHHEHNNGGELQQTCAGQGYVCVHRAQCNNGVVNTNGAGILQAKTKKQYCNTKTEICCRIEISTLAGAGGLQGSLGVGSATFSGSGSQAQGGGSIFATTGQQAGASGFEASGSNQRGQGAFGGQGQGNFNTQTSTFESSSFGSSNRGNNFGAGATGQGANGFNAQGSAANGFNAQGQNGFNNQGSSSSSFGSNTFESSQGSFGSNSQGAFGTNNQGQGAFGNNQGAGAQGANGFGGSRGVTTIETSSFESSSRGGFGGNNAGNNGNGAGNKFGAGSGFNANGFAATGSGSTFGAGSNTNKFGQSGFNNNNNEVIKTTNTQTNFVETDTFSSGSEVNGIYRPGAGPGLKPGVPYLPPVDNSNSGSSVISSTAFASTPIPTTPRPIYTTPRPTYLPPSTAAPGYLPPEGEQTINTETRVPGPTYNEGELILDANRFPNRPKKPVTPQNLDIPSGCAAALKCTPIEFCTAEGVMSNTTVALTRDQEAFRVPLTDCKDVETGVIGKCCRDPNYSDPWPVNLIGKWTEGVFGGNDGKYTPDSRGSPNIVRPVTVRPAVTGSVLLNNFRTPKPTTVPIGPNQVTPGYPATTVSQGAYTQKGQYEVRGQGQYGQGSQVTVGQGGQGQFAQGGQGAIGSTSSFSQSSFSQTQGGAQKGFNQRGQGQLVSQGQGQIVSQGQGQIVSGGRGQYANVGQGQIEIQEQSGQSQFTSVQGQRNQGQLVSKGQGQLVSQGQGQIVSQGQGQIVSQGQGQIITQGQGQRVSQGQGALISQGGGAIVSQGAGASVTRGQGQYVSQGSGFAVSQGQGQGIRQGQGFAVSQGQGFGVENEYSESIQRVFLQRYNGGGQCGLLTGQKPYGNRNELEVDFAEIPWQAMVLLQTNKSLLCGGVITRPDVVVTSAACVEGLQAKNVLIKGGEWKLGIDDEPLPFQIVQVKHILRHPFYKAGSLQYDAAILVLTENLRLAKNIYPICLPGAQETLDGFYNGAGECMVTGWGKQVLQAHLQGSILHSMNISLINPGECQAKLSQDYPHLLEQYDQDSCACGQPTNPINNICRVDIGSALACTMGDGHFVLRGVYSWDSGCQPGNQLAAFYKFDLEWYEWAIGLIESARFAQFSSSSQSSQVSGQRFSGQINAGTKGSQYSGVKGGVKGGFSASASATASSSGLNSGFGGSKTNFGSQYQGGQFSQFQSSKFSESSGSGGINYQTQIKPIQNSFSATYTEKKVYQSEPKIITYTTKPEIITYTTKPEIFTYTTKPKIVTYTTKPQIITYETSGSGHNPQYVAPGVTFNPSFSELVGTHTHSAKCKCLDQNKK
ncbi:unnamed protein product [Plutella xylostella]|uniref:(diamondback moth) hypothetical protein n=1 Tax=Plutella xylostella TaxID=51655 RepID=A0A8S4G008_PLUXY|nr:unnamed protein product [Plutella xylostella]